MASKAALQRMPTKTKIGPYNWNIQEDTQMAYEFGFWGYTVNKSKTIKIDDRQSDTELPQTFLHEILHAIGLSYEISSFGSHTVEEGNPTDDLDRIASALLMWIRDNPEAVKYLQSAE
tara:strand:- start:2122 stop:2475 length:354 start_codon:yes stop_codon:yes gene_type:complete